MFCKHTLPPTDRRMSSPHTAPFLTQVCSLRGIRVVFPHLLAPLTLMENVIDRAIRWLALAAGLVSLVVYAIFYML